MAANNGIEPLAVEDPDRALSARTDLPVVVIGAGPVGLAAAAHLVDRSLEPLVLEAAPGRGQHRPAAACAAVLSLVSGPGPGQRSPAGAGRLDRPRPRRPTHRR